MTPRTYSLGEFIGRGPGSFVDNLLSAHCSALLDLGATDAEIETELARYELSLLRSIAAGLQGFVIALERDADVEQAGR
jgi:hypothetical protein